MAYLSIAARQARALATLVFEKAQSQDLSPEDMASLIKAWDTLRERERILRGRPLPGSLRPVKQRKVRRSYQIGVPAEGDIELISPGVSINPSEVEKGEDKHD